jgi:hypothetical protein
MTTVGAVDSRKAVTRNWAGVLIAIIGAGGLVFSLLHGLLQDNVAGSIANILVELFAYFPGVIAVLVAAIVLGFGTGRLAGIVGSSRWGRVSVCAWAILNAASQLAFIGYLTDDATHFAQAEDIQATLSIATVLVGLVAAAFVLRAHVVTGFARVSLFIAVLLFAVTEALQLVGNTDTGWFWDIPRLAGLAILGISYWRAGVVPRAVAATE